MTTFKDAVLQLQDQPSACDQNVFTYEQLKERLNQPKVPRKTLMNEDLFDFVNVNINAIMCVVEDIKETFESHGIMNEFEVKDMINIIYECVQIHVQNEETSDDENENENDYDPLDIV